MSDRTVFLFVLMLSLFLSSSATTQPPCDDLIEPTVLGVSVPCDEPESSVCLPIPFADWASVGLAVNGTPYEGPVLGCDFISQYLINYAALPGQGALGPYQLDDWTIDGQTFSGQFADIQALVDSINVWNPSGNWTLDTDLLSIQGGDPNSNYGPMQITHIGSGIVTILNLDTNLIPAGTAVSLPQGVLLLEFTELSSGCIDTLLAALACVQLENIEVLVPVGQSDTICFDTSELLGDLVSIENICPDASGEAAILTDLENACIEIMGIEPGEETACYVLCDSYGICDTVILEIMVEVAGIPPIAMDDSLFTLKKQQGTINVLANDIPNGSPITLKVLEVPVHGSISLQKNGVLTYQPDRNYCEEVGPDRMVYELCNPAFCDTAVVHFIVDCDALNVYNGFSPNGDGLNDTFTIEGILNFPNSLLTIYNRWGAQVFVARGYQNDWEGMYKGKPLPTGTYFYQIEFGQGQIESGFINLRR